jgi:hypothetical protein
MSLPKVRRGQPLYVASSSVHGQGVFTAVRLRPGAVFDLAPTHARLADIANTTTEHAICPIHPKCGLVLTNTFGGFLNHDTDPNAVLERTRSPGGPLLTLVIIRNIEAAREVLIDYGPFYNFYKFT